VTLANSIQAREAEPYLAKFQDDWATGQILRQYINGKQKYENAKAKGMTGGKRKRTSSASPGANKRAKQPPSHNDEEVGRKTPFDSGSDDNGEYSENEIEWTGFDSHSDVYY
jgi:hypothetical protein